jgi:hypothetical protein
MCFFRENRLDIHPLSCYLESEYAPQPFHLRVDSPQREVLVMLMEGV